MEASTVFLGNISVAKDSGLPSDGSGQASNINVHQSIRCLLTGQRNRFLSNLRTFLCVSSALCHSTLTVDT